MKNVAILGSTGSIGTQTLDVIRCNRDLNLVAISAGSNIALLEQQIREFHPKVAAVWDEDKAKTANAHTASKEIATGTPTTVIINIIATIHGITRAPKPMQNAIIDFFATTCGKLFKNLGATKIIIPKTASV